MPGTVAATIIALQALGALSLLWPSQSRQPMTQG
jgi:hypothetical protein